MSDPWTYSDPNNLTLEELKAALVGTVIETEDNYRWTRDNTPGAFPWVNDYRVNFTHGEVASHGPVKLVLNPGDPARPYETWGHHETRTTSSTGGEKGVKPERYDLLPKPGVDQIARVFNYGATKYDDHNWRRGYEWSKSYAALQRHLTAWWAGEDTDPESGLSHLGHAGFHILALATWETEIDKQKFDDRYRREVQD